ncbi:unnamed protein product [Cuscuta epithymum]|uniref:Bifunctional inhibitor/plant lipid transfer protein/seed storage helical domain-containing protein n=1 Tax=Cuscuta epithymum TaxID=186058 RepID=A0AAV0FF61_9ASTE|nr:unnamed protein product [Cuscuta epithymum]
MASSKVYEIVLAMVILTSMLWNSASAQSNCITTILSLSPCLNYITGNSSAPSSSCCSQLSSVVASSPRCLCSLLNGGGSSYGININQTLATSMPGACKLKTPPLSSCNGGNGRPTASAAVSPPPSSPVGSGAPPSTETPTTPSGSATPTSGSNAIPSPTDSASAGSHVAVPFNIQSVYLFAAGSILGTFFC